jgi:hypothetical protein
MKAGSPATCRWKYRNMEKKHSEDENNLMVEEILFFLQEKRTALRMVRIGISAVIAQIAILSFLIAASKYYEWIQVMHLWIPFALLNLLVLGTAAYLIFGSLIRIHKLDRQIFRYKETHHGITDVMD